MLRGQHSSKYLEGVGWAAARRWSLLVGKVAASSLSPRHQALHFQKRPSRREGGTGTVGTQVGFLFVLRSPFEEVIWWVLYGRHLETLGSRSSVECVWGGEYS